MNDGPIDMEKARNARLPKSYFVDLPIEDDPTSWVSQLFESDGRPVNDRTGLDFGLAGYTGVTLTARQCREFASVLLDVADQLERTGGDGT